MYTTYIPGMHKIQKRAWDALELELGIVMSCHVHAGSQAHVLHKNNTNSICSKTKN